MGTDIIEWASGRSVKSIAFDYDLVNLVEVPVKDRVAKIIELKAYANKLGIDFFGTWDSVFRNMTTSSLLFRVQAFCAAVEGRSLEFNVDGTVRACSHSTTNIGHVDTFERMFQKDSGMFKLVEERFPGTEGYCRGCPIEGPCGGQCHVTREASMCSIGAEKNRLFLDMCDFYRAITDALLVEFMTSGASSLTVASRPCTI